jgi:hypothetical protein
LGIAVLQQGGLQIAPNPLIHRRLFLIEFGNFLNDFNVDAGLFLRAHATA